jgi:hypothetical protein
MALVMGTASMLTGREGQGSRALSEDHSRNLYLMCNSTLDDMTESYQRDMVDRLWAMNGLNDDLKPQLAHEDAAFKDAEQIARVLRDMAAAGAILAPDDPAINDLRNLIGISEADPMDLETLALVRGDPAATGATPMGDGTDGTGQPAPGGPGAAPKPEPKPKPAPKPKPKPKE